MLDGLAAIGMAMFGLGAGVFFLTLAVLAIRHFKEGGSDAE